MPQLFSDGFKISRSCPVSVNSLVPLFLLLLRNYHYSFLLLFSFSPTFLCLVEYHRWIYNRLQSLRSSPPSLIVNTNLSPQRILVIGTTPNIDLSQKLLNFFHKVIWVFRFRQGQIARGPIFDKHFSKSAMINYIYFAQLEIKLLQSSSVKQIYVSFGNAGRIVGLETVHDILADEFLSPA